MTRLRTALAPLALVTLAALPLAPQRVSKEQPKDVKTTHAEVWRAHEAGQSGKAVKAAKDLLGLLQAEWTTAILTALPAAPEGFEVQPQPKKDPQTANALAGMAGMVGTVINQRYTAPGKQINVNVQADSPLVQMFGMWVANPQMLGPDAELIKYEGDVNAVLKKEGKRWSLQMLVGTSLVEAKGEISDDALLKMFDQVAVDRLRKVLEV